MARRPIAQTTADAQARAVGNANGLLQAQALQSPALRRSKYLADALESMNARPKDIRSGGQLAAELLAQGITQISKNRADKAVAVEAEQRTKSQAGALAAALDRLSGAPVPPPGETPITPQAPNPLAQALSPKPPETGPAGMPMVPVAPVEGAPLPPVGQMPPAQAAPPAAAPAPVSATAPVAAAPTPAPNGPTPGESAYIRAAVQSGDPARIAEAQSMVASIEQRMIAPPEFEIVQVNGVPYRVDLQTGIQKPLFEGGIPELAQTKDEFNPSGTRQGTLGQRDPTGRLNIIEKPPEGFEAANGRLQPIAGGPQDQTTGGNQITNERNLRGEYQRATDEYRTVKQAFKKVEASLAENTGIGDVGGIFGVMKIFDPGSTVREGEAATVQNSGGVPEQMRGLYNRVITGERLTPEQRRQISSVARAQFETYEQGYQDRTGEYIGMAEQYGLNPSNVVGNESPRRPAARQSTPAPSGNNRNVLRQRFTREQAIAEARRRRGGQ